MPSSSEYDEFCTVSQPPVEQTGDPPFSFTTVR
jgi:hypothetical protein